MKNIYFLLPYLIFSIISLFFFNFAADEYTYLINARIFSENDFLNAADQSRFPAFPFILSLFYKLLGESILVAKLFNIAIGLVTILVVFKITGRYVSKEAGFFAALILATNPFFLFLISRIFTEPLFILFLVLSVFFAFKSFENGRYLILFGISSAILVLTRYIGLYVFPILLFFIVARKRFDLILSNHFVFAAIAFLLTMSPYFYLSLIQTGNPIGHVLTTLHGSVKQDKASFNIPDLIPSYTLALPFLLGALMPIFIMMLFNAKKLLTNSFALFISASCLIILIFMEIQGIFNFALLRYITVIIPFLAIISAFFVQDYPKKWKTIIMGAIALNFILALTFLIGFNSLYTKHQDLRLMGEEGSRLNCASHFSNAAFSSEYHLRQKPMELERQPDCILIFNSYNQVDSIKNFNISKEYALASNSSKYLIYKKTST